MVSGLCVEDIAATTAGAGPVCEAQMVSGVGAEDIRPPASPPTSAAEGGRLAAGQAGGPSSAWGGTEQLGAPQEHRSPAMVGIHELPRRLTGALGAPQEQASLWLGAPQE